MKKNPWEFEAPNIEHTGSKITLPSDPKEMTLKEARQALERLEAEQEQEVSIAETVDCFPLEGARAFVKVLKEMFGYAQATAIDAGFFGSAKPSIHALEVAYGVFEQVVWGAFTLPGMSTGYLESGWTHASDGRHVFQISGVIRKKYERTVKKIADAVRAEVAANSIYRGKAIQIDPENGNAIDTPPRFLDTSRARPEELIFSADIAAQVDASLFNPIRYTEACRRFGIPLKRGVLLAGPFGTGKTLTANVTAQLCEKNGWTYIHLKNAADLEAALTFARRYQPAVVFAEDIDRVMQGERTEEIDAILNTIDGVDSKGTEIITILTTNDVDSIAQAMLRPGRLDAVIPVTAPDAEACERLVRLYARGLVSPAESLAELGQALAGSIPAVIREVVERAKLYALPSVAQGAEMVLTEASLLASAHGMLSHLELLKPRTATTSAAERLGQAFQDSIPVSAIAEATVELARARR